MFLFADDTSIFYSNKNRIELERILNIELNKLSDWLTANKLSLNVGKSNVIIFRPRNAKNNLDSNLKINDMQIKETDCVKYLGILIDNKIIFTQQTCIINQKLNRGNSLLAKLKHFVPHQLLKSLYYAHFHSFLDYGILVWSTTAQGHLQDLSKTQDKAVRIMNFCNKTTITAPLYKEMNILPITTNVKLASGKLIWRISNNCIADVTKKMFFEHGVLINERDKEKFINPHIKE